MVTPSQLRGLLEAIITSLPRDGRYDVDDSALAHRWVVSPDPSDATCQRDLLARIRIGGFEAAGPGVYRARLDIAVLTAMYSDTRSAYLSGDPLTAEDRIHGAAQHLLDAVADAPIPCVLVHPVGYSDPELDPDGLWYTSVVSYLLTLTR